MLSDAADVAEVRRLMSLATRPAVERALAALVPATPPENPPEPASHVPASVAPATSSAPLERKPEQHDWTPIERFAWEDSGYGKQWVTVYIDLEGVGEVKEAVSCSFHNHGFDFQVRGIRGVNYRKIVDNLDKRISPDECKTIVKKDSVRLKLAKAKGELGFESWLNFESKKTKEQREQSDADPTANINNLLKDMYDEGDDSTRKMLGEAMLASQKSRNAENPYADALGEH
mmetsp:Transcript_4399/g.15285  ORF Transcript_4399/g.15285 Transcript_4399/m.15285 type:complete len:231 (+) Transcript_4399:3-695(+)